jgi:hypothetical protein
MKHQMIVITDYTNPVDDFILQMIQITQDVNHFDAQVIVEKLKLSGDYDRLRQEAEALGYF